MTQTIELVSVPIPLQDRLVLDQASSQKARHLDQDTVLDPTIYSILWHNQSNNLQVFHSRTMCTSQNKIGHS